MVKFVTKFEIRDALCVTKIAKNFFFLSYTEEQTRERERERVEIFQFSRISFFFYTKEGKQMTESTGHYAILCTISPLSKSASKKTKFTGIDSWPEPEIDKTRGQNKLWNDSLLPDWRCSSIIVSNGRNVSILYATSRRNIESIELNHLKRTLGWRKPVGLFGYQKT